MLRVLHRDRQVVKAGHAELARVRLLKWSGVNAQTQSMSWNEREAAAIGQKHSLHEGLQGCGLRLAIAPRSRAGVMQTVAR